MRKIYLFILFSFCIQLLAAQNIVVKGKITDATTHETLVGVSIGIDSTNGAMSDVNGDYHFSLSPGNHTATFYLVGYLSQTKKFILKTGDTLNLNISLKQSANELDQVVVSAGKFDQKIGDVTVSMEVIKPELVENKNTTSMDDIINQVPGVDMVDGQANIRGGSGFSYGAGSRFLVLVDDLPMLTADAGDVKWNFLPIENLSQIEIIKGASSALFGSSALDGVINIRTAYPTDTPLTKVTMYSGVYMNPQRSDLIWWGNVNPTFSGFDFMHSQKINNLDLVVAGNVYNTDGYRQLENEERYRCNVNLRYRSKKHVGLSYGVNVNSMYDRAGLFLLWANADSGGYKPSGGAVSEYKDTRTNVDPFIVYISPNGDKQSLRTRFFNSTNTNNTEQGSIANVYYAQYQFQKHISENFTFTTGLAETYTTVKSDSLYGMHKGENLALFAQFDKKIKNLTLSFGARAEYYKLDTSETKSIFLNKEIPFKPVLRAGANYHIAKYTYLRASYGQGYRFPSVAEKYIRTNVDGLQIDPNPALQPETGWTSEIGIKQGLKIGNWNGYLDVAGFWTQYQNMMEFTFGYFIPPTITNPSLLDYVENAGFKSMNVGNTQITGIDVTVTGTGKIFGINTTVLLGYTYTNPTYLNFSPEKDSTLSTTQNILKYRFYHDAKADIQFDYKKWSTGLSMRYNSYMINIDKRFVEPLLYDKLPSAPIYILPGLQQYRETHDKGNLVFDCRISYQIAKTAKLAIIVNNLFNAEYMARPGDIMPPRNITLQLSLRF
ncbi:MAG TPA: TonB-dependent receptor [Bacteroidia bacterium]|nr:TonB-dependent receptor [Bacteroidia bacterium]